MHTRLSTDTLTHTQRMRLKARLRIEKKKVLIGWSSVTFLLRNHSTSIHFQYQQHAAVLLIRFKLRCSRSNPLNFNSQNYYFSFLLDYTLDHEHIQIHIINTYIVQHSSERKTHFSFGMRMRFCVFLTLCLSPPLFGLSSPITQNEVCTHFFKKIQLCRNSSF